VETKPEKSRELTNSAPSFLIEEDKEDITVTIEHKVDEKFEEQKRRKLEAMRNLKSNRGLQRATSGKNF
jgi:hypothetical protein